MSLGEVGVPLHIDSVSNTPRSVTPAQYTLRLPCPNFPLLWCHPCPDNHCLDFFFPAMFHYSKQPHTPSFFLCHMEAGLTLSSVVPKVSAGPLGRPARAYSFWRFHCTQHLPNSSSSKSNRQLGGWGRNGETLVSPLLSAVPGERAL